MIRRICKFVGLFARSFVGDVRCHYWRSKSVIFMIFGMDFEHLCQNSFTVSFSEIISRSKSKLKTAVLKIFQL